MSMGYQMKKRNDKKVRQESRSSQRLHSPVSSVTLEQMSDGSFELVPLANVAPPNHHPLSSTTPHDSGDALLRSLVATRISLISCSLSLSLPADGYYADRAVLLMDRPRLSVNIRFVFIYFHLFPLCNCNTDLYRAKSVFFSNLFLNARQILGLYQSFRI